ncbi:MAG: glutamine synthetase family protein [Kiloniellales bacterium]
MPPQELPRSIDTIRTYITEQGISHIKIGLVDLDGVIRGKYMSRDKFLSSLEKGLGFCKVVFGWDCSDQLYDVAYTGWHNGFPDDELRIVPETVRRLPNEPALFFLCDFTGEGAKLCPRNLASRVLARAAEAGFATFSGFEFEFFGFDETPTTAREKDYRNLKPLTPSTGGYSVLRSSVQAELFTALLELGELMDFPIEGLHPEAGEGAMEAALSPAAGLESADRAVLFKTFAKVIAQRRETTLSFMARPLMDLPGCGGHLHLSLRSTAGEPVFYQEGAPGGLSEIGRAFVAGQQRYMPEFLAMTAPTVNAFTRLAPGYWAPTAATWGFDNRTCALRVVGQGPQSLRIEYRVAAADANPYLVFSAALASGLAGIEQAIEPTPAITTNAYEAQMAPDLVFPRTLHDAAGHLRASKVARDWFGDAFVEHFAATREFEDAEYRRHVSDWELRRYFELI